MNIPDDFPNEHDEARQPEDGSVPGAGRSAPVPIDDAQDAAVVENYPLCAIEADYPYAAQSPSGSVGEASKRERPKGLAAFFHYQQPSPAQYMVPRRFGMSAILGIMTALAMLFGAFRLLNADPLVYLFFGSQTLVICFAQMLNSRTPRLASSLAGAVLVPLFVLPLVFLDRHLWGFWRLVALSVTLVMCMPLGAFLGYLTGTCAAGIFLVMDYLEPYLQGQGASSRSANV